MTGGALFPGDVTENMSVWHWPLSYKLLVPSLTVVTVAPEKLSKCFIIKIGQLSSSPRWGNGPVPERLDTLQRGESF